MEGNRICIVCALFFYTGQADALTGWNTKYDIIVNADAYISSDISDFPLTVHIDNTNIEFWNNIDASNVCRDVRFTMNDGTTLLDFETESCNVTEQDAWFHVKVPTLSSSADTIINTWVGNASPGDGIDGMQGRNREVVWDGNYIAVIHNNTDHPLESAFGDSSANANDGADYGSPGDTAGQIDRALSFSSSAVDLGDIEMGAWSEITVETWASTPDASDPKRIVSKDQGGTPGNFMLWFYAGAWEFKLRDGAGWSKGSYSSTVENDGNLHHVVGRLSSNSKISIWMDGAQVGSIGTFGSASLDDSDNEEVVVGADSDTSAFSHYWNGDIDEVRLSDTGRSDDWIKASYQSGKGTWLTLQYVTTGHVSGAIMVVD